MDVLTCKDFLPNIWPTSLCFWALQSEGEEKALQGTHALRDQNAACTLRVVHVVVFDHLAGLCLRGRHNLVSSVDVAYHGHSQRIRCEDIAGP